MTPSLIAAAAGSALSSVQHIQGAAFLVDRFQETESLGLRPEALFPYPVRALNFHKFSVEVGHACCVKSFAMHFLLRKAPTRLQHLTSQGFISSVTTVVLYPHTLKQEIFLSVQALCSTPVIYGLPPASELCHACVL